LLLALLAALSIGSALADGDETLEALEAAGGPLSGHTLSCSVAGTPLFGGCYYEISLVQIGPLGFAIGLDGQLASPNSPRESYLAPYALVTLNLPTWGAWLELAAPSSWGIPVIGRPESFRAGFTLTFQ